MRKQTGKHISLTTIRRLMRQTKLNDALLVTIGKIDVYWIDSCEKLKVVHKQAKELNGDHLITLNQAHAKSNETTEASKKKLTLRIAAQSDMGRAIAQVKRKSMQPVTKLFRTTAPRKFECTNQQKMSTVC